jgi:hypothetical protein
MAAGPRLKTLDDLLAQAEHYASYSMGNIGRLPPTLFLIGPDGSLMFMPESLGDDRAKDDFANTARLMCIAHAATAAVMALEAWATVATPEEPLIRPHRPPKPPTAASASSSWARAPEGRSRSSC